MVSVRCVGVMNGSAGSKLLGLGLGRRQMVLPALSAITFKEWGFSNSIKGHPS